MLQPELDYIAVLDFGGQYAHLIANRVRALGVYCTVEAPEEFVPGPRLAGLILSGGPQSVTPAHAAVMRPKLVGFSRPLLGICFGHQLLAKIFGGELAHGSDRQYGPVRVRCAPRARLFRGLPPEQTVWMSHGDHVARVPPGFHVAAGSDDCPVAAYEAEGRDIFGLQFHPEVVHTPHGLGILKNFTALCRVSTPWEADSMKQRVIEQTRAAAGDSTLFLLVSGGVDSLVTLQVCIEAVGAERVRSLHVDTGLMRLGESDAILEFLAAEGFRNIEIERAEAVFLHELAGVTEPERKRAIIGRLFVDVLRAKLRAMGLGNAWKLVQGTIYPDTIESGGTKNAALIKTHHNRVPEIQAMIDRGEVVEPLRDLYKDEVRLLGRELGLPQPLLDRHPFPGPGLGIRLLCHDGSPAPESFADQARLDQLLRPPSPCGMGESGREMPSAISTSFKPDSPAGQARGGLHGRILPVRSVGVQGDERSYRHQPAGQPARRYQSGGGVPGQPGRGEFRTARYRRGQGRAGPVAAGGRSPAAPACTHSRDLAGARHLAAAVRHGRQPGLRAAAGLFPGRHDRRCLSNRLSAAGRTGPRGAFRARGGRAVLRHHHETPGNHRVGMKPHLDVVGVGLARSRIGLGKPSPCKRTMP